MEKIISYTLGSEGIFPKESILGGVQGEHRATAVEVTPDLELTEKIAEYTAAGKEIALKIEVAYLSGGLIYTEERCGEELFAPFYITGEMTALGLDICIAVSILCDGSKELCKGLISLYFTPCPSANYISRPSEEGEIPYEDIAEELRQTAEHYDEVLSGKVNLAKSYTETSARHLKRVEELAVETEQTKASLQNGMELRILSGGADAVLPAIPDGETGLSMRGVFGYREDTYQNWLDKNPVLMRGEPSIVRDAKNENWLKIGDGKTPWRELPFLKGPKGEKGDTGEQGIQGEKGDKGDNLVEKPWQLIYGTTLSEPITQLQINKEQYPEFKEIHIEARILPTDKTLTTQNFYITLQGYNLWHGYGSPKTTGTIYLMADIYLTPDNGIVCSGNMSNYFWTRGESNYTSFGYYYLDETRNHYTIYEASPFIILKTDIADGMGVGTKIRIWGR